MAHPRVDAIVVEDPKTGDRQTFAAKMFIDAGYEGDLMARAGVPYRVGREARSEYDESIAGINMGDPESLGALWAVATRRDFWPRRWWSGWGDLVPIARDFLASFAGELTIVGVLFVFVGLVVAVRQRLAFVGLLVLVAMANVAILASHGSRSDLFLWHRYYIPAYLSAALVGADERDTGSCGGGTKLDARIDAGMKTDTFDGDWGVDRFSVHGHRGTFELCRHVKQGSCQSWWVRSILLSYLISVV